MGRFSASHFLSRKRPLRFDDWYSQALAICATGQERLARQPEPPALVLNEPSCYHFRVRDPRVSATLAAVTIGHCYHN
jgi:hypothetical protein